MNTRKLLSLAAALAVVGIGALISRGGLDASGTPAGQPQRSSPQPAGAPRSNPSATSPMNAEGSTLKIGSWNIEWLGKPDDRSGAAKGVAQSPDDMGNI